MLRLSLRAKLLLVVLLALAPTLALLVASFRANYERQRELVLGDLTQTAQIAALLVDATFDEAITLGWAVASEPLVQSLDPTLMVPHLRRVQPQVPRYANLFVADARGEVRGRSLVVPPGPPISIADRPYFQRVMATGQPTVFETVISRSTGRPASGVAVPMFGADGRLVGLVGIDVDPGELAERLASVALDPAPTIALADPTGRLMLQTGLPDLAWDQRDLSGWPELQAALAGRIVHAVARSPLMADERALALVRTPKHGWVVWAGRPVDQAFGAVDQAFRLALLGFGAIALFSLSVAGLLGLLLTRPIRHLTLQAQALGRGELDRRADIRTGDELESLGGIFNAMADDLQRARRELETVRDEATARAQQLDTIIEAVPESVIVVDRQGRVVSSNSALAALVGLADRGEALRPLSDYEQFLHVFYPDGRPMPVVEWGFVEAASQQRVVAREARLQLRDGRERLVQASVAPVRDERGDVIGSVAVARDVTEERRWERQHVVLAEVGQALSQKLDLRAIVDTVMDQTLAALGADIVDVVLPDWPRHELVLAGYRNLRPETVQALRQVPFDSSFLTARAFAAGQTLVVDDASRTGPELAGARTLAEQEGVRALLAVPLKAAGRPVGSMVFGTRTPRRFSREDLETITRVGDLFGMALENARLYQESLQRADQLEEERRRREVFISVVAHELNNLLTPLSGYAQILLRGHAPAEVQRKGMEAFGRETGRLQRLVTDLLDVSRIETQRFHVEPAPMDLAEVVRGVVEAEQLATARHALLLEAPERLEGVWDRDRLAQVLTNLVRNAIKYSPEGGLIRIVVDRTDEAAQVCVADQGIGISPEHIALIFEPYSRLYRERQARGLGLGLFIARAIVEAHNGRLWAESPGPGRGSTFCFSLPLQVDGGRS